LTRRRLIAVLVMLLPKLPTGFVLAHTVKKGGNNVRVRHLLTLEGKKLGAMDGKPARLSGMAVGHGKQDRPGRRDILACVEKDRIDTALGQVQVRIKTHDTTLGAARVCFEDLFPLGSGLFRTGVLDLNESGRAVGVLKDD